MARQPWQHLPYNWPCAAYSSTHLHAAEHAEQGGRTCGAAAACWRVVLGEPKGQAHVFCLGAIMALGIGVTLCRDSAEPLREDPGDEVSLAMPAGSPPWTRSCRRQTSSRAGTVAPWSGRSGEASSTSPANSNMPAWPRLSCSWRGNSQDQVGPASFLTSHHRAVLLTTPVLRRRTAIALPLL